MKSLRSCLVGLASLFVAAGCAGCGTAQSAAKPRTPAAAPPVLIKVVLPSRTIAAGSRMSGQVVVDNNTGHAIHADGCGELFTVALASRSYHPDVAMLSCLQFFTIPVGRSSYPVQVLASYLECHPRAAPACLPASYGRPDWPAPPLPPGRYQARLFFMVRRFASAPPGIPVRVTPK